MDIPRHRENMIDAASPLRLSGSFILVAAGVAFAATLCATGNYRNAAVITGLSLGAALLLLISVPTQSVLLAWFATTPLASFYIRYPLDRSIITYNRVVFGSLAASMLLGWYLRTKKTEELADRDASVTQARFTLTRFEIAWAILSVIAFISAIAQSNNVAYATRIAIDTFWLPLIAFYVVRNHFDLRSAGRLLLLGTMALALFLFATGAFELATGIDLFQYKGAELVREGERRVNGPFAADSSFAVICLMLFLFLQAAPRLLSVRFDRTGRLVYVFATVAAAMGALLPLFRIVAFALAVSLIIHWRLSVRRAVTSSDLRRVLPAAALIAGILIVLGSLVVIMVQSKSGSRLLNPRTVFGRLATWQGAAEIAIENPVAGVGLANYADYYDESHYYSEEPPEEILDTKAVDRPHSNALWIASELGLLALVLYIVANLYLFLMGWRALKLSGTPRQRLSASCYLAIVAGYWIPGLTLASGYYSDLNLCFMFLLGALSTQFAGAPSIYRIDDTAVDDRY
jgi:O-antigen ligase